MSKETVRVLKELYKSIGDNYVNARDSFYDCERKEFHLLVSSECLTLAECKLLIADKIIETLEKGE